MSGAAVAEAELEAEIIAAMEAEFDDHTYGHEIHDHEALEAHDHDVLHDHAHDHEHHGHGHEEHEHATEQAYPDTHTNPELADCPSCAGGGCEMHSHHAEADSDEHDHGERKHAHTHGEEHVCGADCEHHKHDEKTELHEHVCGADCEHNHHREEKAELHEHICNADCPHHHHEHEESVAADERIMHDVDVYEEIAYQVEQQLALELDSAQADSGTTEASESSSDIVNQSDRSTDAVMVETDSFETITEHIEPFANKETQSEGAMPVADIVAEVEVAFNLQSYAEDDAGDNKHLDMTPTEVNTNLETADDAEELMINPKPVELLDTDEPSEVELGTTHIGLGDSTEKDETVTEIQRKETGEAIVPTFEQLDLINEIAEEIPENIEIVTELLKSTDLQEITEFLDSVEGAEMKMILEKITHEATQLITELSVLNPNDITRENITPETTKRIEMLLQQMGITNYSELLESILVDGSIEQLLELLRFMSLLKHEEYRQEFLKSSKTHKSQIKNRGKGKLSLVDWIGFYIMRNSIAFAAN